VQGSRDRKSLGIDSSYALARLMSMSAHCARVPALTAPDQLPGGANMEITRGTCSAAIAASFSERYERRWSMMQRF
jgi:hypothetical protein